MPFIPFKKKSKGAAIAPSTGPIAMPATARPQPLAVKPVTPVGPPVMAKPAPPDPDESAYRPKAKKDKKPTQKWT